MESVIVLPDLHIPNEDRRSIGAVLKYIEDTAPHSEVVQVGDLMDFKCISHHTQKNLRASHETTLVQDYRRAGRVLDDLQDAMVGYGRLVILEGNHDFWVEKYIDEHPQLEGQLELEHALHFPRRGVKWVRFWRDGEIHKFGKAIFSHGLYTNEHHAKRHALAYGNNVFYGHVHDVQTYSLTRQGEHSTIVGQSIGCLCKYNQEYMHGQPSKWQQAFMHMYFHPNGTFQYYIVRIFNNKFIGPNGKEYKG
jgi:hypothetical protein